MTGKSYAGLLAGGWRNAAYEPFRTGVDICWLEKGATDNDPSLALLRYAPGASVPRHRHPALETIMVLEGSQSDEAGEYGTGDVVLNPAGSVHSVRSAGGCVVLIHWTRPVEVLGDS
jgi:anti-sigma factor ChrR (cupin superfamily)